MDGYKTYIGILIAVAPTVAGWFGFSLTPAFGEQVGSLIMDGITLAGAAFAFYGRLVAVVPGWFAKK